MSDVFQLLVGLAPHASVEHRLRVLDELIGYLDGPSGAEHGFPSSAFTRTLPWPLRRLYEHHGRRPILSRQNRLLTPDELEIDDHGRVVFWLENQCVYLWSTSVGTKPDNSPSFWPLPVQEDDPPVWGRFNVASDVWTKEDVRLSEFLIQACLFEAVLSAPYGCSAASLKEMTVRELRSMIAPLPLGPWRWPAYPTRFHAGQGVFMIVTPNGTSAREGFCVYAGATQPQSMQSVRTVTEAEWDDFRS